MTDSLAVESAQPVASISIGAIFKRSFGVFFANIVPFGVLALILQLPGLIYNLTNIDQALGGAVPSFSEVQIAVLVLSIILSYVLMGALVFGTVTHLRGRRAGMGEIVARGLGTVLPVIVIGIGVTLLMGIGFMLLVIPGIFVAVVYAVAVPAYVVEKPGIIGCFNRSWELTKGNRWRVLGILILFFVFLVVVGLIEGAAAGVAFAMDLDLTLIFVLNYVLSTLSFAVLATASAVLYHDLRVAKEGASSEQIAAVFD